MRFKTRTGTSVSNDERTVTTSNQRSRSPCLPAPLQLSVESTVREKLALGDIIMRTRTSFFKWWLALLPLDARSFFFPCLSFLSPF